MAVELVFNNFTSGEVSPKMAGRNDLPLYTKSLSRLENAIVSPFGGIVRRHAMKYIDSFTLKPKIFSFSRDSDEGYIVVIEPYYELPNNPLNSPVYVKVSIIDGNNILPVEIGFNNYAPWNYLDIYDLRAAQYGDLMVFAHGKYRPWRLLKTADGEWNMTAYGITDAKLPTMIEDGQQVHAWSDEKGWPHIVKFMAGRLWFAKTDTYPTGFWGSSIKDITDFHIDLLDVNPTLTAASPIGQILTSADPISDIHYQNNFFIFTEGEEFVSSSEKIVGDEVIYFAPQGNYGMLNKVPIFMLDGMTIFIQKRGNAVRVFYYSIEQQRYLSLSINVHAGHLHKNTIAAAAQNAGNGMQSNLLYLIDADGTASVMHYNRDQEIQGWARITTDGEFIDVASASDNVYFVIKRGDRYDIELLSDDYVLDSAVIKPYSKTITGLTHLAGRTAGIVHNGLYYNTYQVDNDGVLISDLSITGDVEIGYNFHSYISLMPIARYGNFGNNIFVKVNVLKVGIMAIDTIGLVLSGANRMFFDRETPDILSGDFMNRDVISEIPYNLQRIRPIIEIVQPIPYRFNILAISTTVGN